jgi:hypothetical protein
MDLRNAPRMHAIKERRSHSQCQQIQGPHFGSVQPDNAPGAASEKKRQKSKQDQKTRPT